MDYFAVMYRLFVLLFSFGFFFVKASSAQESSARISLERNLQIASELPRSNPSKVLQLTAQIIHSEHASDSLIAAAANLRGIAHVSLGARDSALWYFQKAMTIFERMGQREAIAETANHIGRFYRKYNFQEALKFYNRALDIYTSLADENGIATILNESGVAFEYAGQYDSARSRYEASLLIRQRDNDTIGIAYSLEFISGVLALQGQYESALEYNLEALALREAIEDSFGLCINYHTLANIYLKLGNVEAAAINARKSEALSHSMNFIDIRPAQYALFRDIARAKNELDSALYFSSLYDLYKDSIFALDKNRQVEALTALYEASQKESLIQQQKFEISRKNYFLVAISFLIVVGIIIAALYYKRNQLRQKNELQSLMMRQQQAVSVAIVEAEEEERKRIARDLHDGVGQMMSAARMNLATLLNEQEKTLEEENRGRFKNIIKLVDESCRELRTVSHQMMPNSLIKNSLSIALRNFIDKLDHRALNMQLYTEGLDNRIDLNIESVFYRVIQECVNNVIKHANADRLDISIIRQQDEIVATIEDNGIGFDTTKMEQFEGIGLKNIKTRVAYLDGQIEFDSSIGRGTVVAIHIPLKIEGSSVNL